MNYAHFYVQCPVLRSSKVSSLQPFQTETKSKGMNPICNKLQTHHSIKCKMVYKHRVKRGEEEMLSETCDVHSNLGL